MTRTLHLTLFFLLLSGAGGALDCPEAIAQGLIYGSVLDPLGDPPPTGEVYWMGFLDGTDEEIRIESNVGSGYDGGIWFDDFQNYTSEAAGNRYDYLFHYPAGGLSVRLAGLIPNNSFEEQNVVLTGMVTPPRPVIVDATVGIDDRVRLTWASQSGVSHRIYRRESANNGLFRRLDDPSGDTLNVGASDTVFVDSTALADVEYAYIIVGVNEQGALSAHSAEVAAVPETGCSCPYQADIDANGSPDAVDLQLIIDIIFFGTPTVGDPDCAVTRADFDCSGFDDVTDLALMIDYLFFGGPPPCDPCS